MLAITRKKFMIQERRWIKLSVRVSRISTSRYRSSRALAKTRFLRAIDMGKIDWSTTFKLCLDSMNLISQELSNFKLVCFLNVLACSRSLVCKTEHDCKQRDSSREWKQGIYASQPKSRTFFAHLLLTRHLQSRSGLRTECLEQANVFLSKSRWKGSMGFPCMPNSQHESDCF